MSSAEDSQARTLRAKKASAQPPPLSNPAHSGPTTFFLRSEKEVEKSAQRGRRTSRGSSVGQADSMQKTPMASTMGDSSFGVQSLEDTNGASFSSDNSLSRVDSNTSNASSASVEAGAESSVLAGRKRKAGNPVHPKIAASGQRILSAGHLASDTGSPMSLRSAESPMRSHRRRGSATSSININISQPLTPLPMSPKPESAMPSTPRSGSPKSFRLSDEEVSIASDTGSQAIQSSTDEDDDGASVDNGKAQAMPQLVMPSITMPSRRPFTERGRRMGRMKLMIVGPRGVGKTKLIQSICRSCEDIVHVDPIDIASDSEKGTIEIGASTRPYPNWWTDFESRRMLHKRKSVGEGVLERNVLFIDTPGCHEGFTKQVREHLNASLARTAAMERMNDIELINMLSGEGGVHIDAVLYLMKPTMAATCSNGTQEVDPEQCELLRYLCKWTNVIPLVAQTDTLEGNDLIARKKQVVELFKSLHAEPYSFLPAQKIEDEDAEPFEPFAVSSAIGDDTETIDASILMSSTYLQPLIPSELNLLISHLFEPENIARLRHVAATKFLLWRQENLGNHIDLQKQLLLKSPSFEISSPVATSTGSIPEDPSKVLVPHGASSYFRSASPSGISDSSAGGGEIMGTSTYALARYNDTKSPTEPFRQVRLAKWAQDLQRSLDNERKRYKRMYSAQPNDWVSSAGDSEKASSDPNQSLVLTSHLKPAKGRLGGEVGIIDPRDPLGVLAFGQTFRRQGWFALQLASSCGLIGAVAWWVMRNWAEVQDYLGFGSQAPMVTVTGVSAPTRGMFDTSNFKGFFGREGGG